MLGLSKGVVCSVLFADQEQASSILQPLDSGSAIFQEAKKEKETLPRVERVEVDSSNTPFGRRFIKFIRVESRCATLAAPDSTPHQPLTWTTTITVCMAGEID
jgi:hypothetical protein